MTNIEISFFTLTIATLLFNIGLMGLVLNRSNILKTIMSLELLLLSVSLCFIAFSFYLDDLVGQIFVLFILTLSATESSIGLSILAVYYTKNEGIDLNPIKIKNKNLKV